jgi:hypothetical protein
MDTAQISELLECLEDWGKHFKRKQHPVTLTLLRAASVIREQLAAGGGTVGQARTNLLSAPGGDSDSLHNAIALPQAGRNQTPTP